MLEMRPFTLPSDPFRISWCTLPRLTLFYLFILSFLPVVQRQRPRICGYDAAGLPTLNLTYMKAIHLRVEIHQITNMWSASNLPIKLLVFHFIFFAKPCAR